MKIIATVTVLLFIFSFACTKTTEAPRYAEDSPEYEFFKRLAVKDARLDPDKADFLISTSKFRITTNDVMPDIYGRLSQRPTNLDNYSEEMIQTSVVQIANVKALKKLLMLGAQEYNITVEDSSVEARIQQAYAVNGGEEAFLNEISKYGFTMDYVRQDIRNDLIARKYREVVQENVEVSEEEIVEAYGEDVTATVRHILKLTQSLPDSIKEVKRAEMEKLLERARAGEDFAELAEQHSDDPGSKRKGGLYEAFPRGRMVKPFEDAAFDLPIGSISDIVETAYGYHIIKVEDRQKETRPLEHARVEIEQRLLSEKKRQAYDDQIEILKKKYRWKELY
jgi:parvulin-like peptidyl-prolyl isomerase